MSLYKKYQHIEVDGDINVGWGFNIRVEAKVDFDGNVDVYNVFDGEGDDVDHDKEFDAAAEYDAHNDVVVDNDGVVIHLNSTNLVFSQGVLVFFHVYINVFQFRFC